MAQKLSSRNHAQLAFLQTLPPKTSRSRRGGGLQMKVRGLKELLGSLDVSFEGAMKRASTPGSDED